jgi:hypothetical protein
MFTDDSEGQYGPPKSRQTYIRLHGVISQNLHYFLLVCRKYASVRGDVPILTKVVVVLRMVTTNIIVIIIILLLLLLL